MITNSNSNILMRRPDAAIIWISVDTKRGFFHTYWEKLSFFHHKNSDREKTQFFSPKNSSTAMKKKTENTENFY